eukprot:6573197-Prymnesium_polylepis.1
MPRRRRRRRRRRRACTQQHETMASCDGLSCSRRKWRRIWEVSSATAPSSRPAHTADASVRSVAPR